MSSTPPPPTPAAADAPTAPTDAAPAAPSGPSHLSLPADFDSLPRKQQLAIQRKIEKEQKKHDKRQQAHAEAEAGNAAGNGNENANGGGGPLRFKPREWSRVEGGEGQGRFTILSWNMLAQALVRRDLFPGSDMLKIKDRVPALMQEMLHYAPDIACLQEVDRLSEHLPSLTRTHSYSHFVGYPNKSHGLVIAHKSSVFDKVGEKGLRLDELPIHVEEGGIEGGAATYGKSVEEADASVTHSEGYDPSSAEAKAARKKAGLSRSTRNVALLVALKFKDREGGVIIGTTHLFWHPQHSYERARQAGILAREALAFRDHGAPTEGAWRSWPVFLAGDFNTQPVESTYALLKGVPLTPGQVEDLQRSTVVHQSVDKLHNPDFVAPAEAESEGTVDPNEEQDPDKVLRNCRLPKEEDGLPTLEELKALYGRKEAGEVRSAYGEIGGVVEPSLEGNWYCQRNPGVEDGLKGYVPEEESVAKQRLQGTMEERIRRGDFELSYTNYTPCWRCSLDYIFLLPPSSLAEPPKTTPVFTALLQPHKVDDMWPGLPRKGVSGSDHVAVAAEIQL